MDSPSGSAFGSGSSPQTRSTIRVAARKAQIAAASLTVADARKDVVTFGPAYQTIQPQVIYRLGGKKPRDLDDLLGSRLEVVAQSSHAALLEQLRAEVPTLSWVEDSTASAEELIRRVAAGEIDYTIADSHLFAVLRHFYPDLRVAFSLGRENQVAWALPRGEDSLRESIAPTSPRSKLPASSTRFSIVTISPRASSTTSARARSSRM